MLGWSAAWMCAYCFVLYCAVLSLCCTALTYEDTHRCATALPHPPPVPDIDGVVITTTDDDVGAVISISDGVYIILVTSQPTDGAASLEVKQVHAAVIGACVRQ